MHLNDHEQYCCDLSALNVSRISVNIRLVCVVCMNETQNSLTSMENFISKMKNSPAYKSLPN